MTAQKRALYVVGGIVIVTAPARRQAAWMH
jgi:hypothetical protein